MEQELLKDPEYKDFIKSIQLMTEELQGKEN